MSCLAQRLTVWVQRNTNSTYQNVAMYSILLCFSESDFFLFNYGPLHALKPQRGSDASDSNRMSACLEGDSTVSTDTAGQQRMISEFPLLAIFRQNAAAANQVLSSELQIARWRMTFKSRQQHAGNSWGWSVSQRDLFQESESSILILGSWRDCKNRNGAYLWRLQIHGLNVHTQRRQENDPLRRQWVTA